MLKLPDELLLSIAQYLVEEPRYDRDAYDALTSLALTHRRFTNVVRDILQGTTSPCVSLCKTHSLVRTLFEFPEWAKKITGLEITNFAAKDAPADDYSTVVQDIVPPGYSAWRKKAQKDLDNGCNYGSVKKEAGAPSRLFDITFDKDFSNECTRRIRQTKLSSKNRFKWRNALSDGRTAAFLALLLSMLPNLEVLCLGASHALAYPMLFELGRQLSKDYRMVEGQVFDRSREMLQMAGHETYLIQVFNDLCARLKTLAKPVVFDDMHIRYEGFFWRSFRSMHHLEHLIIPGNSLPTWISHTFFPPSLQRLTILDATDTTDIGVLLILSNRGQASDVLPNLRLIAMFYTSQARSPYEDELLNDAALAGVAVTLYHPTGAVTAADVGGKPWMLSEAEIDDFAAGRGKTRAYAGHWVPEYRKPAPAGKRAGKRS